MTLSASSHLDHAQLSHTSEFGGLIDLESSSHDHGQVSNPELRPQDSAKMSYKRIAAVTGANKGIGLAIGTSFSLTVSTAP
jgi:hypothetical protein